jgi:AcrR family transcriptional regulator
MGRSDDKRARFVAKTAAHLLATGLSDTGLRSLARVCGTSDRMLIYHFASKDALLEQALDAILAGMTAQLDSILGAQRRTPTQLLEDLLRASEGGAFAPVGRLWFELVGRAVRDEEPYLSRSRAIGRAWLAWIETRLKTGQTHRAGEVFANLEGTLMLHLLELEAPGS